MITPIRARCLYVTCILLAYSFNALGNVLDFQTTRLKSTGGTGVGSILVEEAMVLNPASLAFFNVSSIYIQKTDGDLKKEDPTGATVEGSSDILSFIATDTKGGLKGSVGYAKTEFMDDERKMWAGSVAANVGKKSAFGATYRFVTDKIRRNGVEKKEKYQQTVFGVTHVVSPRFTLGLVAIDPFKKRKEDTRGIIGGQYVFNDMIAIMGDIGADYNENISDTLQWNAALQVKVLNDFFLRVGTFDDKGRFIKGNGIGLGWVQPRLIFDFAFKNMKSKEDNFSGYDVAESKETSFSLSFRW